VEFGVEINEIHPTVGDLVQDVSRRLEGQCKR
jgi:hypothetical protein